MQFYPPLLLSLFIFSFATSTPSAPSIARKEAMASSPPPKIEKPILEIDTGGHKAIIKDVIFTSDGKHLVSASDDKTVRVWDVRTGKTVRVLRGRIGEGHEGKIYAAALSPDNRMLAVGGKTGNYLDRWIRFMAFRTGKVLRLLKGHTNVIRGLTFSPDGRLLISGSFDKTARIWNVIDGKTLHVLKDHTGSIYAVAFSPDGKRAVTGSYDSSLKLWDVVSGELLADMKGHDDEVRSVSFTPDGRYILSGSHDKTIRLWDGGSGEFIKVLAKQGSTVNSLSVSPDGTKVVTGTGIGYGPGEKTKHNNVFSIPSGERLTSFTKHDNIVLATAISPDGETVATGGGSNQEIYLWDIHTGKVKRKMVGKGESVWSVGFAKDGKSIAWGNVQLTGRELTATTKLKQSFHLKETGQGFSLTMGKELKKESQKNFLRAVESVGDLSIGTKNGQIHPTLEIRINGKVIHEITRGSLSGNDHRSLTLTRDGSAVISGGTDGILTSYNPKTGKKIHDFTGHTGDVWAVAVSPDGRYLVSGSHDQTVRLWEVKTGKLLLTIFQGDDGEWMAWTPDGFYTSSPGGARYAGYHISRGEDKAADYVGLDQVGEIFFRPDLVAKTVQGGFEKEILVELEKTGGINGIVAAGPPPSLKLLSKKNLRLNQRDFTIKFSIEDQGGGIGRIEYRVNGVSVASMEREEVIRSTGIRKMSGVITKDLTGDHGTNKVSVTITNEKGNVVSRPMELEIEIDDQ